jgi:hypothetical protein
LTRKKYLSHGGVQNYLSNVQALRRPETSGEAPQKIKRQDRIGTHEGVFRMEKLRRGYDSGMGFDLWVNQGAWFWGFTSRLVKGGIVGAARTKAEAIREGCAALEELSETFIRQTAT